MKHLILLTALLTSSLCGFGEPREYTPSPVEGPAWNAPGNLNPLLPGYFADPTIRRFGDTYYIYATTDGTGNGYGPAQVWMSYDLRHWRNAVMNWPTTEVVWAPDVVQQPNGRYRYYYCEPCVVSCGESDSPTGPWENILGREDAVLVPDRYVHNAITLDPQLFRDDDGQEYLYFTTWGIYAGFGCGVARLNPEYNAMRPVSATLRIAGGEQHVALNPDRAHPDARYWNEAAPYPIPADTFFAEKRLIPNTELKDIFEAPFVFKRGGIYYFTYSSGSCHTDTYRVQYATSKVGPMGPFTYQGELLTTNQDETVHGPGHHSIIDIDGRYYIVYHRHNIPRAVHGFNRQVCIDPITFSADGRILPITPHHDIDIPAAPTDDDGDLAYGCAITATPTYSDAFRAEYAVDHNNATLWRGQSNQPATLVVDLGRVKRFNEVWLQPEYPTFYYQYLIETSTDGTAWTVYADRRTNTQPASPLIDKGKARARYIRLTITGTEKNGHAPALFGLSVYDKAPKLPPLPEASASSPLGASAPRADVAPAYSIKVAPRDTAYSISALGPFKANKPLRARVKDGRWALYFNGTQYLRTDSAIAPEYRYNGPYSLAVWAYVTEPRPLATIASLSASRADLATTELRLGTDPQTGLVNHNGSFESYGTRDVQTGAWHHYVYTFDGYTETVYRDGEKLHEQNNFIMLRPEGHITIGAASDGTNTFQGYLADLRLSTRPITQDEARRMASEVTHDKDVDHDFDESDPDSRFQLPEAFRCVLDSANAQTLSTTKADFNTAPYENGARKLMEVTGDFVFECHIDSLAAEARRAVVGYNEAGLIATDGDTHLQWGVFPLYNCGNMLTVLSRHGRPQYPAANGYDYDRYIHLERRGNLLYARHSRDHKTWTNASGSPVELTSPTLTLGLYQTTYNATPSSATISQVKIYQ